MLAEDWRYWSFRTSPLDKNGLVVCEVTTREPIAGWTNFLISREHAEQVRVELLGREAASGLAAVRRPAHAAAGQPSLDHCYVNRFPLF